MTATATTIAKTLRDHVETISPGQPYTLTAAHEIGDMVWQGDLGIEIADPGKVPAGYVEIQHPTDADRQLVPHGGGPGSHHRLKSFDGVRLYRPKEWGESDADLRGPYILFASPNEIVHESGTAHPHGTVVVDAPMAVTCRYQRNLSVEERVLRAAD